MPEISVPNFAVSRRRTRTYDARSDNAADVFAALIAQLLPSGTFIPTAQSDEPSGDAWRLCNGQALVKADFPTLFEIFGATYGETSETFNLPDLRGRMMMGVSASLALGDVAGAASINLTVDQLPTHTHGITDPGHGHTFSGDPHSHTITDPGHTHESDQSSGSNLDTMGSDNSSVTTGATGTSTTGISINDETVTGTVEPTTTGITIDNVGAGDAIDITPPVIGINWLVRT